MFQRSDGGDVCDASIASLCRCVADFDSDRSVVFNQDARDGLAGENGKIGTRLVVDVVVGRCRSGPIFADPFGLMLSDCVADCTMIRTACPSEHQRRQNG